MQNVIKSVAILVFMGLCLVVLPQKSAHAAAEVKEVCKDKIDKAGNTVMKAGKAVQDCKKIKVHKKLEGTAVPEDKKKK
jgi:uncharacterized protein YjeT (DUF2065 family)